MSDAGVPLQNSFVINFTIPGGTSTISGLQPVLPLGSLIYQGTTDNVLLSSSDVDTYTLAIDPNQTLAVVAKPVTSGMSVTITLISPSGNVIGTATSPTPGAPARLPGVQSSKGGTYTIEISGGPGEYTVTPTLNAYIDPAGYGGPPNTSIATATPIDPYANNFVGKDSRTAVIGALSGGSGGGGLVSTDRYTQGLYSVDASTGASTLIGGLSDFTSFSGMAVDPSSGTTYISDVLGSNWSLATIDRTTGQETILGPQYNESNGAYDTDVHALVISGGNLYGFSYSYGLVEFIKSGGSYNGTYSPVLPYDSMPEPIENAAIDPSSGTIYGIGEFTADIYTIDLSTATATLVGPVGDRFLRHHGPGVHGRQPLLARLPGTHDE